ncbi:DNA methyltransferase [Guptibacillus hwajinpoensis]|uniref:DNA methyltransferase n=1 Tax=Guptibacillus hwajinpoensis TaxID=208199 RepID=UPI001CFD56C9|nr:DNA methyltransferase [Pseudalkalibacillus hwajinpoensis]
MEQQIKNFREKRGWTQEELAKKVGVSKGTINRWEKGASTPSKLANERLTQLGVTENDMNQYQKKVDGKPFHYNGERYVVKPQPYVLNAPTDQNNFHDLLINLQEHLSCDIPWDTYKERLSLIECVDTLTNRTSQSLLEKRKENSKSWNSNYGTHGWHRYIGRFPPHLVRALLNYFKADSNDLILDPFAGSGTTLVECRLVGIPSIGIEICPLSALITNTKSKFPKLDENEVFNVISELEIFYLTEWTNFLNNRNFDDITYEDVIGREGNAIKTFANYERWFSKEALLGTSILVQFAREKEGYIRDAILVALSSKMRSIGNVDVDVVRAEYSKKPRENVNVLNLVTSQLSKMAKNIKESYQTHKSLITEEKVRLIEGDVLKTDLPEGSISHVITSPPYGIESISYLRTHLLSYRSLEEFLGADPYKFGDEVIGSEYLPSEEPTLSKFDVSDMSQTYKDFFKQFLEQDLTKKIKVRVLMMMKFFDDMNNLAIKLQKWVKDGGKVAFVIGNKKIGTTIIPTDQIIREIFESNGFIFENSIGHKLKTNNSNSQVPWQDKIIKDEFVMLFQKETD